MTKTKDTAVTVTLPTARKPDVSQKLKERFGELCQKHGIPEENIVDLTDDGTFIYLWFLFLNPHVTEWREPREGNTSSQSPCPNLGNRLVVRWRINGLEFDCPLFCLCRSLSPGPGEPWGPGLQVGDV